MFLTVTAGTRPLWDAQHHVGCHECRRCGHVHLHRRLSHVERAPSLRVESHNSDHVGDTASHHPDGEQLGSGWRPRPNSVVANGTATSTITATVTVQRAPVTGDVVTFVRYANAAGSVERSRRLGGCDELVRCGTVTYTAATTAGFCTITATERWRRAKLDHGRSTRSPESDQRSMLVRSSDLMGSPGSLRRAGASCFARSTAGSVMSEYEGCSRGAAQAR